MGKKRSTVIGSDEETQLKTEHAVKLQQKKLRTGKGAKPAVVDTIAAESPESVAPSIPSETKGEGVTKSKKPVHVRSKTYKTVKALVDPLKTYSLSDSIVLLRKVSLAKFDPTVELHLVLKKSPDIKLSLTLPHASGQKVRKVAIATDEVIVDIAAGKIDFDVLVSSPAQMGKLVKFAKVLGPKGLMPNPKTGTVSTDPEATAKQLAADKSLSLKLDKGAPVIHTTIGKLSFTDKQLEENIAAVLGVVSTNLKKAVLKSTMSPAIKLHA